MTKFHQFLVSTRPDTFADLSYSTVKGWFQNHAPKPNEKVLIICNALQDEFGLRFDDSTEVMSWWLNGGHYPFSSSAPVRSDRTIRVFHAEDHEIVINGVFELLKKHGMQVVGHATTVADTLENCFVNEPDVIIVDLNMNSKENEKDGIGFIQSILDRNPAANILVFSFRTNPNIILSAYQYGAKGYVTKDSNPEVLVTAINTIVKGDRYYMANIAEEILDYGLMPQKEVDPASVLNEQELNIFLSVSQGMSNEKIAQCIGKDEESVQHTINAICTKLDIKIAAFEWIARKYNLLKLDL
ncbi:MAG: response regulator transcription factor [Reinekea sp.]